MSRTWTSLELLRAAADYFKDHGLATPRLDAEVLLAHALGVRRLDLYLAFDRPAEPAERARYRELIRRRAADRMPVAYLTGTREFWSRSFQVSPAVLVPRPETETLIDAALRAPASRVLEIGVGSGIVAGTLAMERPDWKLVATDLSAEALQVARENLRQLGVLERVLLVRGDALSSLRGGFDLIVSNPPYIPSAELERLEPELRHEPQLALDGGRDGLDVVRRILQDAEAALRPGGRILLEVGAGQAPAVARLMRESGATQVSLECDLRQVERVVRGEFGNAQPEETWTEARLEASPAGKARASDARAATGEGTDRAEQGTDVVVGQA